MSMCSASSDAMRELLEIFTTGSTGQPVGVPRPVVKHTTCTPPAANPVTCSMSWPGVP